MKNRLSHALLLDLPLLGLPLLATLIPASAHAYIGPGAGFAVAGSFLVFFTAMAFALFLLLTWPIRYVLRAIRFRRVFSKSRVKKVVVLGLDGMDFGLTKRMIDEGKLPHFARLRDEGSFAPLASTVPPISPVAWSSFQTGTGPGKHNIFDFLTRDRKSYGAKLSSTEIRGPSRVLRIGRYRIPIGGAEIRLMRKAVPFWKTLGDHGVFSSVLRVPISFPPEKFYGVALSAMCAPDLRGTQGTFSFYTTGPVAAQPGEAEASGGGEVTLAAIERGVLRAALKGPDNPRSEGGGPMTCPFTLTDITGEGATLRIGKESRRLAIGAYSDWIAVEFKAPLGLRVSGIARFLLKSTEPELRLYVTPINIDPAKPAMPISHPPVFATYLAKRQGPYATLGLIEDSWALNERLISDSDFLAQCLDADAEREKMFFDSLENVRQGLCVCVFDGTDRVQHAFWREIDPSHPYHEGRFTAPASPAIEEVYKRADGLVGRTLERCKESDTVLLIVSDHGFNGFCYGVDLNRWLEENGYLVLHEDGRGKKNLAGVDWSRTRAFAIGLAGIFLNLKGRESKGIVDPKKEAPALREEIARRLEKLEDPARKGPAVKQVYNALEIYSGPFKDDAPDLLVGYHKGYRASWETAIGQVTDAVFSLNRKAWSGDHCVDQSLVPGILLSNRRIEEEAPRLMDIGPTVLDLFGVAVPRHMDGRPLKVCGAEKR